MQKISAMYKKTGSLQRTAEEMGVAYAKIRKVLITLGEYTTPFSKIVYTLRHDGYSVNEIAKKLNTTSKRVTAWLPYERSIYNVPDRSPFAVRSDNYRKRIQRAKKNLILNKYINNKEERVNMRATNANSIINEINTVKEPKLKTHRDLATIDDPIRLNLKLKNDWDDEEAQRLLRKYGRSSSGNTIERDILIPPDITLHSLHYAIQRLFGWQNSHLHSFRLPEETYQKLTHNTVRGWGNLIGVLFQTVYPDNVWHIRYGDDDYERGSAKAWLRSKYTGPYGFLNEFELYDNAVNEFTDFVNRHQNMDVYEPFHWRYENKEGESTSPQRPKILKNAPVIDLTLDELNASLMIDDGTSDLLERLLVSSILAPEGTAIASSEKLNQKMIKRRYRDFGEVAEPEVIPVTNKLFYHYDYGDNWIIEMTRLENHDDLLDKKLITKEELADAQNRVIEKYKPVCIHQDGMFVLDDVGGFGGFIDMLRTLYEPDDQDKKEEMRIWASSIGWNTRKVSNKEML